MATKKLVILLTILMDMVGIKAFAYDIAVENADGVTIYYYYISNGNELMVTHNGYGGGGSYRGVVVIPEEVTYADRTRKVTVIGGEAFFNCDNLTSVILPQYLVNF